MSEVASWFVVGPGGMQLGRSPWNANTFGGNWAWRTYFSGLPNDQPRQWRPPPGQHILQTQISSVFLSLATYHWILGVSTPIDAPGDDHRFLGVLALTVEVGRDFGVRVRQDGQEGDPQQFAVLVDWRDGKNKGLIFQHRLLQKLGKLPKRFADYTVTADDLPPAEVAAAMRMRYRDPLAQDPRGEEYAGPWLAISAPVHIRDQNTGLRVIVQERHARARIAVLVRLPEIISGAASDTELFVRLINVVLAGIPTAGAAALVRVRPDEPDGGPIEVLHWDCHLYSGGDFQPSEQLIRAAIDRGESVLHVWDSGTDAIFTARDDVDWAFCTPVLGAACRGWAIYVAGGFAQPGDSPSPAADPTDLRDDLKFTEVAASTLRSLREVHRLQRRHTSLSQFFSPIVLEALAAEDPDVVLAPRETEVSVLFCDLRGFSRQSEMLAGNLLELLHRVSRTLGVTTHHILAEGGVVGDFQGDAAMGFWGWPLPQPDAVERACRAALAIRAELQQAAQQADDLLAGFQMGIGIATGNAVAGKIGTIDQVKVTVFGPVVNLASRLEGMTKILSAPILVDEPTARYIRDHVPRETARCRRLAVVRPAGLETPLEVSELLPPAREYPALSDQHLADYEAALDALQEGNWSEAFQRLHRVPADDRVKDFLTGFIVQHHRTPPSDWDGVIRLSRK